MLKKILIALRLKKPEPVIAKPRPNYPQTVSRVQASPRRHTSSVSQSRTDTGSDTTNTMLLHSSLNYNYTNEPDSFKSDGGNFGGAGASGSWELSSSDHGSSSSDSGSSGGDGGGGGGGE